MGSLLDAAITGQAMPMRKRPSLEQLLVHPVREIDNGALPEGMLVPKLTAPMSSADEGSSSGSWMHDHVDRPRFYLGGLNKITIMVGEANALHYYNFVKDVPQIAEEEGWPELMVGRWDKPASYNQFRNAFLFGRPMLFDLAVQVLLACERAVDQTLKSGRGKRDKFDVYDAAKIIPACYNIDGYNAHTLADLRSRLPDYDGAVLSASGQKDERVFDAIADGKCVTRRTAQAIRWTTLQLAADHKWPVYIGDVRGTPGRRHLGRGNATDLERVDLKNWAVYRDEPTPAPSPPSPNSLRIRPVRRQPG